MKTKLASILLVGFLIVSCSHFSGYKYNEQVANLYFRVSEPYEEIYYKLTEGLYDNDSTKLLERNIEDLDMITNEALAEFGKIELIEEAKVFHSKTGQYLRIVNTDFIRQLHIYADLDNNKQIEKDSVALVIQNLYSDISVLEDEMQSEQLKFADKIGLNMSK